jgi:hypothetical protein
MQAPLPREALERSDRSGESSLPVAAGQDGASHQISVTERGVVHPKSRYPLRAEGGARDATEPARVCSGAARASPGCHPSREGGPAGRGRRRHRPAPQGGDPIAAAAAVEVLWQATGHIGPHRLRLFVPELLDQLAHKGALRLAPEVDAALDRLWTLATARGLPRSRPPLRSPLLRAPRRRPR